jgi:hypothetical protein
MFVEIPHPEKTILSANNTSSTPCHLLEKLLKYMFSTICKTIYNHHHSVHSEILGKKLNAYFCQSQ